MENHILVAYTHNRQQIMVTGNEVGIDMLKSLLVPVQLVKGIVIYNDDPREKLEQLNWHDLQELRGMPPELTPPDASQRLVELSQWIDAGNAHRDPEARTWGRLAKLTEEGGEVITEYIGATGQNPRKGVTSDVHKVGEELLDVAVTALGAYEHIYDHPGLALAALESKIISVADRALAAQSDIPAEPVPKCLSCDEPAVDSGEGRFCAKCQDYEGTCINDHCLTCGAST